MFLHVSVPPQRYNTIHRLASATARSGLVHIPLTFDFLHLCSRSPPGLPGLSFSYDGVLASATYGVHEGVAHDEIPMKFGMAFIWKSWQQNDLYQTYGRR